MVKTIKSEERRVGKERGLRCSSRWPPYSSHLHTNNIQNNTNINRTTQITTNLEECAACPLFASFNLAFARKVRKNLSQSTVYILPKHPHITKLTHKHTHTHYKTYTHTHTHTQAHTLQSPHTHTPTHTHTHTHTHKPTHTHTHTHTHT
jgi:ABC-type Zn2+ transport system substrate-binding protein/surface adhesin